MRLRSSKVAYVSSSDDKSSSSNVSSEWPNAIVKQADKNGICLCTSNELPSWHFQHRGIASGYRYCHSVNSAISSLKYWHNESINMWMHYIAAISLFLYFLYRFDFSILNNNKFDGYLVIIVTIIGNVIPMFASAFCHNFYCVNKNLHKFCWFFDFWAILTSMLVGGIGYLYFSFYCNPNVVRYGIGIYIGLYLYFWHWCWVRYSKRSDQDILKPRDRFPEFSFSLSSFITFVSFIPVGMTWLFKEEYINDIDFYNVQFQCTFSPILLSLGVVLFAQGGVPERFTGVLGLNKHFFDMIGHSHQCWHLCTAMVMFGLLDALVRHCELRDQRGCSL